MQVFWESELIVSKCAHGVDQHLGYPQPPTPIKTDNKTVIGFANDTLKIKKSKSWDMRYYWIKDKVSNQDFVIYWDKGLNNYADYFTKHFVCILPSINSANLYPQRIFIILERSIFLCTRVC